MGILLQVATTVMDTTHAPAVAPVVPQDLSVLELLMKGGFIMIPLVLFFAIALFFIIERYLFFRQRTRINEQLVRDVLDKLYSGNIQSAEAHCIGDKSALGNVLQAGISQLGKPIDHIEKALEIQSNI